MVWRIVGSDRMHESYRDVKYNWAFVDIIEAHEALDCFDDVAQIYRPEPVKPPKRKTR